MDSEFEIYAFVTITLFLSYIAINQTPINEEERKLAHSGFEWWVVYMLITWVMALILWVVVLSITYLIFRAWSSF